MKHLGLEIALPKLASQVRCPVCGAACEGPAYAVYSASRAAAHFCLPWRDADRHARLTACIRRLWGGDSCEVRECAACGFGFSWPHVGGDREFYEIIHESAGYTSWRWEYGITRDAAAAAFPRGGRVLDIGAGDGSFLMAMPSGWERCATESTDMMRGVLEKKGVRVFRDLEEACAQAAGTFQVVTSFQVLEHVGEFRPMLAAARELTAPGGMCVVSTPDWEMLKVQMRATRCADMPPNHVNKWTGKSMSLALEQAGFKVEAVHKQPGYWKDVPYALYLRVRAAAEERPRSLAAVAYRIRNKKIRGPVLGAVGSWEGLKMLPHLGDARVGTGLACVARAV